jgi:hypothetical protein
MTSHQCTAIGLSDGHVKDVCGTSSVHGHQHAGRVRELDLLVKRQFSKVLRSYAHSLYSGATNKK